MAVAGLGVVALAGAVVAAPPVAAQTATQSAAQSAATAYTDDGGHAVYYTAGATSSYVSISEGENYTDFVINDIVPIEAGEGCVHPDAADTTRVVCTLTEFGDYWTRVIVDLGDGSDELFLSVGDENHVSGGDGQDNLNVTYNTVVDGGADDDWIAGGWLKLGGPGDDTLTGFHDDFIAYGDDGDDAIYANAGSQSLYGGRGHDVIESGDGPDLVYGNSGEDLIRGGRGSDDLFGGPDDDTVYGNSGNDLLRGGGGDDVLSGGPDVDDVIQ
ncbi:calcium-binding protein [Streptomyces sp. 4N509B]|uniref:calcium-binding protein n=1 Tax=Streptomyces sp. 4N509B TaxID=3457413 RepID=UPI003FD3131A